MEAVVKLCFRGRGAKTKKTALAECEGGTGIQKGHLKDAHRAIYHMMSNGRDTPTTNGLVTKMVSI